MGRSIVFSLTVLGLIGLLAWKSREVPRASVPSRSTASDSTAASAKANISNAAYTPDTIQDDEDDHEAPLKMKTSLVIEPVSPEEDRKLQRRENPGKLTEIEEVQ